MKVRSLFAAVALASTLALASMTTPRADASTRARATIELSHVLDSPLLTRQGEVHRSLMSAFFKSRPDAWSIKTRQGVFSLVVFDKAARVTVKQRRHDTPGRYLYDVSRPGFTRTIDSNRRLHFVSEANALAVTDNAALAAKLRRVLAAK